MRFSLVFAAFFALPPLHARAAPGIGGCPLFPPEKIWNTAVDTAPVDGNSAAWIATIGAASHVHPDFGTVYNGAPNGIPYVLVPGTQPPIAITFQYNTESDPGP